MQEYQDILGMKEMADSSCLIKNMNHSEELIKEIQKGLLQWYPWKSDSQILYIGSEKDALAELLAQYSSKLTVAFCDQIVEETWRQCYTKIFDYIICVEVIEQYSDPTQVLRCLKRLLKEDGKMLLGMNNRLGIRYFCGDRDPYTGRNFDGVEGYRLAYSKKEDVFQGRCYSQKEIKQMLEKSGWKFFQFFSVLPDLKNPSMIYAENSLPNEDLANRLFPTYNDPETIFLEEASLYESLIDNGLFHTMANAYLIECSLNGEKSNIQQITCSMERGREKALFTVIEEGMVKKQAAYPEGVERLKKLADHAQDLSAHGISVVETRIENNVCVMPYIYGEVGQVYLKRLIQTDIEKFLQEMDKFRDLILQSSEIVKSDQGDGEGAILRRGYLDMVPLNSFYIDGTFVFYDQEFCEENYPANAILSRMVYTFYAGNNELQRYYSIEKLLERYGLTKKIEQWRRMEHKFLADLRKERELRQYHETCRGTVGVIHSNRQRVNYSEENYRRLFIDIFETADDRKLILFGSGQYAKRFLELYHQEYPVTLIVDNNKEKWGQQLNDIPIQRPESLCDMQNREYKVLICMKNYLSVMKQLDQMGIKEYSIFDPEKTYPRKRKIFLQETRNTQKEAVKKKYHVGYIAGVFDLYHVGHLNMFRCAKEQCDYLIVGVVTDEGVRKYKKTEPFVPFEERIELVRSCRYVDEAVEIPLNYGGTRDAYRLYHFDCQFSGSDYVENPDWLAEKAYLEKHGAEMVFFPYTERTSSTKIKGLIEKKLI